jgi:hypothetical protein
MGPKPRYRVNTVRTTYDLNNADCLPG